MMFLFGLLLVLIGSGAFAIGILWWYVLTHDHEMPDMEDEMFQPVGVRWPDGKSVSEL